MVATAKRVRAKKARAKKPKGEQIDKSTRDKLATCARRINAAREQEFNSIFVRGDELCRAHGLLANHGDGTFWRWAADNCRLGRSQGSRYIRAAKAIREHHVRATVARSFDMTALWELTSPDAPPKALRGAIKAANEGKHVRKKDAVGMIQRCMEVERADSVVELPERVQLVCCDLQEIQAKLPIQAGSVDVLLCDPLYGEADLWMYESIAELAAKALRPGGWCLCHAGKMFIDKVHAAMSKHLEYAWTFDVIHKQPTVIDTINIAQGAKYVVGYRNEQAAPWWMPFSDRLAFATDKSVHKWQQPVGEAEHLLFNLCPSGGTVLDPCCGTGTVGVACVKLGLSFIGGDIDQKMIDTTRSRLERLDNSAAA